MALFIEITIGSSAGRRFKLKPGLRLGRSSGEVLIDDPKASSLHALVEQDLDGSFHIRDLESRNGIKINGLKKFRAPLVAGTRVQIGGTYLTVVDDAAAPILVLNKDRKPENKTSTKAPKERVLTWEQQINSNLAALPLQSIPAKRLLGPFRQALQLHFIEGIQAETLVTLGYGPRSAGSIDMDIELFDPEAPILAFQIEPGLNGEPIYSTQFPNVVSINDSGRSQQLLQSGDLIRVGKTLIRVDFL